MPFVTIDVAGFPHAALHSRAELEVSSPGDELLAVVASRRTRTNLERDGQALLIAVEGTTAHYTKLRVQRAVTYMGLFACALAVVEHTRDSLGIALTPITYRTTPTLAVTERWQSSAQALRRVQRLTRGA